MAPIVRPATAEDLLAYYGKRPKRTVRAFVMVLDGEILGVGGILYPRAGMTPYIFSDYKPAVKEWPKELVKGAKMALESLGAARILAIADKEERGSVRLLTYLGFKHFGTSVKGEVFQYRPGAT